VPDFNSFYLYQGCYGFIVVCLFVKVMQKLLIFDKFRLKGGTWTAEELKKLSDFGDNPDQFTLEAGL